MQQLTFGGITHIIQNPKGSYTPVGSVPGDLPRVTYPTVQSLVDAIRAIPGSKLCSSNGCACRKLFS
jgi:hypothetical protein